MSLADAYRFAVIADAHFHDPQADFGFAGVDVGGHGLCLRLPGDVARAPRIYNEAGAAFRHALAMAAGEGIRDVVLLGDYSDDGQAATMEALSACLREMRERYGMRFFALPGNHDVFGDRGRHRRKRYARADGHVVLVTSDPAFTDPRVPDRLVTPRMYCGGSPSNLPGECGFFGVPDALHWETPFGTDPDPAARTYPLLDGEGREIRRLMDASYLVEPAPGVWLAMVDANVFAPDPEGDDGLADSTAAGWNAVLRIKPFLVDWLRDVADRAGRRGKRLLVFSHYPVLETLNGTMAAERAMMGENAFHRRMPGPAVADRLGDAGVRVHFSGHVHVDDVARSAGEGTSGPRPQLVNIAVPALVAFPAAFKSVTVAQGRVHVQDRPLDGMPLPADILAASRRLAAVTGADTGGMLEAADYGAFIDRHLEHVTARRFLKREWPEDLASLFRRACLADLLQGAGLAVSLPAAVSDLPALAFLADWYRLRAGGAQVARWIAPERLEAYRQIGKLPRTEEVSDRRLALLFETLSAHLSAMGDGTLRIDLATGEILP